MAIKKTGPGTPGHIEKPKTTKPRATPATNADEGVICYFGAGCPACKTFHSLPNVPDVSNIAEVFAASGYFPGQTIAQIATQIIAGRSLGMDPARAMFDLELSPGSITFKPVRSMEKTEDDKNAFDLNITRAASPVADRATPETASNVYPLHGDNASVSTMPTNVKEIRPGHVVGVSEPPPLPEHIQKAIETDWNGSGPDAGDIAEINEYAAEASGSSQKNDDLANKGPLLDPKPENPQGPGPDTSEQSAAQARPGEPAISNMSATADAIESADAAGTVPDDMVNAGFKAIGVDSKPKDGRNAFGVLCRDLGLDVAAKLKEYDAADEIGQRKKLRDAQNYYQTRTETARTYVLEALAADGKTTTEMQKGFFLYAEVGLDPNGWDYPEAVKAQNAIIEFFKKPAA